MVESAAKLIDIAQRKRRWQLNAVYRELQMLRHNGVQNRKNISVRPTCVKQCADKMRLRGKIVVEGIETTEQYEYLESLGITYAKGYYFSKPLPEKEFIEFIAKNS